MLLRSCKAALGLELLCCGIRWIPSTASNTNLWAMERDDVHQCTELLFLHTSKKQQCQTVRCGKETQRIEAKYSYNVIDFICCKQGYYVGTL